MGTIVHTMLVVNDFSETELSSFITELVELKLPYAVSSKQCNGVQTLVVFPTGGKQGWNTEDSCRLARDSFKDSVSRSSATLVELKYGDICPHVVGTQLETAICLLHKVLETVRLADIGLDLYTDIEKMVNHA